MINEGQVYIINTNNGKTECFSTFRGELESAARDISIYLLGKTINIHLLCHLGHRSIYLKSYEHNKMVKEIKKWLEEDISQ